MDKSGARRGTRVLAGVVGAGFLFLGAVELATRLDEPLPLLFWLPTLWGGALLVLIGSFGPCQHSRLSHGLVVLGAFLGFVPSAWTIVMPLLCVALVMLTITRVSDADAMPASGA